MVTFIVLVHAESGVESIVEEGDISDGPVTSTTADHVTADHVTPVADHGTPGTEIGSEVRQNPEEGSWGASPCAELRYPIQYIVWPPLQLRTYINRIP